MQKKIFLQKNLQTGGRSHVKWLMWAAVALIVLVLVTPLLVRHKNPREMSKKPATEKGKVVKEIPKSPAGQGENEPAATTAQAPENPTSAEATKSSDFRPPAQAGADAKLGNPPDKPSDLLTGDPRKAPQWMDMQRKEPGTAGLSAADPTAALPPPKETRPAAKTKAPIPKAKPAPPATKPPMAGVPSTGGLKTASLPPETLKEPAAATPTETSAPPAPVAPADQAKRTPSGKMLFTVQVGSFKDRKNADELKAALAKKGYEVFVTPSVHPKLGQLYVVTLKPVDNMGKASTQVEQIKHEEKVKPIILKVPPGQ